MIPKRIQRQRDPGRDVPAHDLIEFAPRRHEYCVVVFALDEGERVLGQLEDMRSLGGVVDVILCDGGSTDGSAEPNRLRDLGLRALLVKRDLGRLGSQIRIAFAYALDRGYDGVITIDGNGKDDPEAIPHFAEALQRGVDHAQGSRFVPGGHHAHTPRSRLLAVRLIHAPLISRAAGFKYTDTTNGFRGYSRRFLSDPRVAPLRTLFTGYELHYYLAIRAGQLGYRVEELPVSRVYPAAASTPTKISPVRGNLTVLRNLIDACRGRFDPAE